MTSPSAASWRPSTARSTARSPPTMARRSPSPAPRCGGSSQHCSFVMPGLVPGIHVFIGMPRKDVDGRVKPGHDEGEVYAHENAQLSGLPVWRAAADERG